LFKDYDLLSTNKSNIVKTITSSGTSGKAVSKVYLDRPTAINQTKTLVNIMSVLTGKKRLPLLIIDSASMLKGKDVISARNAAVLGFSIFGSSVTYALKNNFELDKSSLEEFCSKYAGQKVILFGFTYVVWEYFCQALVKSNSSVTLENGIFLHGGGWKNMTDLEIDNGTFKAVIKDVTGIHQVYNYYGMAEQTGSIYLECEFGYLHCSNMSDIIIRRPDLTECNMGEPGLIQVNSLLPVSYPGHMLLTEDIGMIIGEDTCQCGRLGKYFHVLGRTVESEVRGCSDVYD